MNSYCQQSRTRFFFSSLVFLLIFILSGCDLFNDTSGDPDPDPQTQDGTDNQEPSGDNADNGTPGDNGTPVTPDPTDTDNTDNGTPTNPTDNGTDNGTPTNPDNGDTDNGTPMNPDPDPQTQDGTDNQSPKAMISAPEASISGQTVTLDGSGSSDPDGDTLSYQWTQTGGQMIELSDSSSSSLTFVAPAVSQTTELTFQLTVNDGKLSNDTTVSIQISKADADIGLLKHWHETNGFGTDTKGGIAGEVYKVTNLNSSGPGSLKDAVSKSNRLVVFEVGGVIEGGFSVSSNVTIAGQTAPYPGITTIKGNVRVSGNDIVISHITHHLGDAVSGHPDAWNVQGSNIVLDHVAVYWGKDETLPIAKSNNVTVYKSIIAEGLQFTGHGDGEHSKGLHIQEGNKNVSVIGSLGANSALRNPRIDGGQAFLANYVLYNWGTGWDHKGPKVSSDDELPGCTECYNYAVSAHMHADVTLVGSVALSGPESKGEYFLSGHYGEENDAYLEDNIIKDREGNDLKFADPAITLIDSPAIWPEGLEPLPAQEALYEVLRTVGPQPGNRNAHNLRTVKTVADGTGEIIDSEDEVGGYPNYPATSRPIEVPDGAEARQAWLDALEDEIAVDTEIDLSRLYNMVGSSASDRYQPHGVRANLF